MHYVHKLCDSGKLQMLCRLDYIKLAVSRIQHYFNSYIISRMSYINKCKNHSTNASDVRMHNVNRKPDIEMIVQSCITTFPTFFRLRDYTVISLWRLFVSTIFALSVPTSKYVC